jgi:hypothetical protein
MNFLDLDQGTISEILLRSDVESYLNLRLTCRHIYEASKYCDNQIRDKYRVKIDDATFNGGVPRYYIPGVGIHGKYIVSRSYWFEDVVIINHFYLGKHVACYGDKKRVCKLYQFKFTYNENTTIYTGTCDDQLRELTTYYDAHVYFTNNTIAPFPGIFKFDRIVYRKTGQLKSKLYSSGNRSYCKKKWDKSGKYISHHHETRNTQYVWDSSPHNSVRYIRIFGKTINF